MWWNWSSGIHLSHINPRSFSTLFNGSLPYIQRIAYIRHACSGYFLFLFWIEQTLFSCIVSVITSYLHRRVSNSYLSFSTIRIVQHRVHNAPVQGTTFFLVCNVHLLYYVLGFAWKRVSNFLISHFQCSYTHPEPFLISLSRFSAELQNPFNCVPFSCFIYHKCDFCNHTHYLLLISKCCNWL